MYNRFTYSKSLIGNMESIAVTYWWSWETWLSLETLKIKRVTYTYIELVYNSQVFLLCVGIMCYLIPFGTDRALRSCVSFNALQTKSGSFCEAVIKLCDDEWRCQTLNIAAQNLCLHWPMSQAVLDTRGYQEGPAGGKDVLAAVCKKHSRFIVWC